MDGDGGPGEEEEGKEVFTWFVEPRLKHRGLNSKRRWCVIQLSKHFEISTPICISDREKK